MLQAAWPFHQAAGAVAAAALVATGTQAGAHCWRMPRIIAAGRGARRFSLCQAQLLAMLQTFQQRLLVIMTQYCITLDQLPRKTRGKFIDLHTRSRAGCRVQTDPITLCARYYHRFDVSQNVWQAELALVVATG
jgi:hypothetical protein